MSSFRMISHNWYMYRQRELFEWKLLSDSLSDSLMWMGRITPQEHAESQELRDIQFNNKLQKLKDEYRESKQSGVL